MDKTTLLNHVTKIFNMNLSELNNYAVTVSMSNVDDKARYFLNKAIDMRMAELSDDALGAYVVGSEIDPDAF